jgi:hypothetical protein
MFPELSIERVFRRELDSLPLPAEQLWVPNRRRGASAIVAVSVGAAALVLAIVAVDLVREASGAATQPRGVATTPPSLQPRASCVPESRVGRNGQCVTPLPTIVRNPAFGYNLTMPGDWREAQMPPGSEPFVRVRAEGEPSLTAPFLLDRRVFTARSPQEWRAPADPFAPAWDLDVQVWDRQGRTALEWSRAFPCATTMVTLGDTNCVPGTETIRGLTVVTTTVISFRWHVTSYYFEHGDQMLILRYMYSEMVPPPAGVTEETLKRIVGMIGLV